MEDYSTDLSDLFDLVQCPDSDGCDLPLAVSMFADVKAKRIEPHRLTLRQLQDRLTRTTAPQKTGLPLIKLGTFGNVRTDKGSLRHDANLLRVSGIEGDYDAGTVQPQEAAERLRQAGLAALIYTTPSHTADAPRWRVLVPLAGEVSPVERHALCARLNGALGGILADESFTPSQTYYFGEVAGCPVESILVEGQPVDRVSGLPSIGPQPKPVKSATDLSDLFREPADPAEVRRALGFITDAEDRGQWLKIGMALHAEFEGSEEGLDLWSQWSRQSPKFNERDQRQKWKSFKRSGVGIGTLFDLAKAYGYERHSYGDEFDFDDLPALSEEEKRPKVKVIKAKNGEIKPALSNAILVLQKVNKTQEYLIRRNDMTGVDEWRAGPINDADLGLIRVAIEQAGMHNVGKDLTHDAVRSVAESSRYHPVRDWLESLIHDGKPRIDSWLTDYLGVEGTAYTHGVGRAFLVAMVARVMRPGCKHDHVLILRGEQGIRKSTACRILSGEEYFSDTLPAIKNDKIEAYRHLRGKWLIEMGELASATKSLSEDLKSFLSGQVDTYRSPYARKDETVKRQCVIVGTTNETAFLRDSTGGRRFWPVTCAKIDTDALSVDRDQLFAEAVAAFRAGEAWHLPPDLEQLAKIEQEEAREEHPWEQRVREVLDGLTEGDGFDRLPKDSVTVAELLTLLGIPTEKQNSGNAKLAVSILRMQSWRIKHTKKGNLWVRS